YRAKAVLPFAQSLDEGCQRRRMRCRNPGHIDQPAPGQREHAAPLLGLIGLYRPHRSYRHTVEAETGEQLLGEPGLAAAAVTLDQQRCGVPIDLRGPGGLDQLRKLRLSAHQREANQATVLLPPAHRLRTDRSLLPYALGQ